jgi:hypothetical protein
VKTLSADRQKPVVAAQKKETSRSHRPSRWNQKKIAIPCHTHRFPGEVDM